MESTLQPPVIIGIAGALAGLLMAVFSAGVSRLPAWRHGRSLAIVALTGAGYCACDLVLELGHEPAVIAGGVQLALAFGVAHGVAWLHYLAALDGRSLDRFERVSVGIAVIAGVASLMPGAIITREIAVVRVAWFGATYQVPRPSMGGVILFAYLAVMMTFVAVRAVRRQSFDGRARMVVMGVAALGVLALNDTLVSAGLLSMPLLLDAGSVLVVVVAAFVRQRRLAEDLAHTQAALARSERIASTGRLAAGIAHEINNPAAVVRHDLEQILQRARDPLAARGDVPRLASHALTALDRVVLVVRRLLDFGLAVRPESAELMCFRLEPVLRCAGNAILDRLPSGALVIDVPEDLSVLGDASRLQDVVTNLLSNAAYAVAATASPSVQILARRDGDRVVITVTDNGTGVPEEIVARMFEPFVNARPFGQGAGLGLAVSHALMRSQNGELRLVRTSATGTEMAIELPIARGPLSEVSAPVTDGVAPAALLDLLIIDDDPDLRVILEESARAHRFRPVAVASVAEAAARVEALMPVDLVLCDLMMPDGGADTWLRLCRERFPQLATRTIIITGGPSSSDALAVADANADRLLYKPFAMSDVRAMATRLLQADPAVLPESREPREIR